MSRYGGDEIVIAIRGLKLNQADQLTKSVLERIRQLDMPELAKPNNSHHALTCSIGMLFCGKGANVGSSAQILELADNQLYEAKNSGKDCYRYQLIADLD